MFSIASAPAKQSVSDTINVLSGRLNSAALLEDRRAAILGLRSFAKDFPASVASGALRSLIGSLADDGEDVDTVKVVLETLLMLFNPNDDSPEASDEIVLWLADEFTQHHSNTLLLLGFLESTDFYSRLYSLQLLAAILSARTQRTEECVLNAPLGISRLVAVLGDAREAIRNEALSLLIGLTPTSEELQKLVAFENAFERLFDIVDAEGSLTEGGRTVEDCLILMANLLRRNASNQSLFRESDCMNHLANLLKMALETQAPEGNIAAWAEVQRNRNIYAFLAVIRLFLHSEPAGASLNQMAFWKHGLVFHVLQLAFTREMGHVPVRAEALLTCGDMIRDAPVLQEDFARFTVPPPLETPATAVGTRNGVSTVYVIDGLLDLVLNTHDPLTFDLRFAACECLKSYLSNHSEVRLHFLSRAIDGYRQGTDESANILTVLMRPDSGASASEPYRQWFAAVIAFQLLHENAPAKAKALELSEGDSEKGEEVVTSIQTITAHLIYGMGRSDDPRSLVGYMMLLLSWLFEDLDAVNDFLAEGSLCAMLLGVAYEFSTKDSPIPRTKLHSILTSRLGRDKYIDRLKRLRGHPLVRDFEVMAQKADPSSSSGLPDVYFDADFVEFLKDNYSRITRAIDRAPELEISVITNGTQKGISRELVDSLRQQIEDKDRALHDTMERITSLEERLGQERIEHRRATEAAAHELWRAQDTYESLQKAHEAKLRELQSQQLDKEKDLERCITSMRGDLATKEADYQNDLAQTRKAAQAELERVRLQSETEAGDLRAAISQLEAKLTTVNKEKDDEIKTLREEQSRLLAEHASKRGDDKRSQKLESQLDQARTTMAEMKQKVEIVESKRLEAIKSQEAAQSELDDLLIVFGDLEDRLAKYEARLRYLGETVSDGEEDPGESQGGSGDDVD
ncbi:general vesicular transport factor [Hirsutella rhossiliensis]|uniref:Uso1/p115-like vesicle tethering protein n=1 Tax=Hirsutella rhossiliensis TaxID=111463 RepID=A0A9P8MUH6_9HYPO|nr:Uso1/p115-like vesicle tethering protein [Hirsutella rhossiliensis]KAH0960674.1 Uso1/p115-like vesicle tethering protein [Hirsutella rhossiliensis]